MKFDEIYKDWRHQKPSGKFVTRKRWAEKTEKTNAKIESQPNRLRSCQVDN